MIRPRQIGRRVFGMDGKPLGGGLPEFGARFIAPIGRGTPNGMATLAPAKLSLAQAFMPPGSPDPASRRFFGGGDHPLSARVKRGNDPSF